MAICMIVQFAGMKADKYEAVNHELDFWKNGPPEGNLSHTAGGNAEGWYVVDVWESQDHWDRFLTTGSNPRSTRSAASRNPASRRSTCITGCRFDRALG